MTDRKLVTAPNVYAALCRCSTPKQENSNEMQQEKILAWAAAQKCEVIMLPPVIESGKIRYRSSVQQALAIVKAGRARGIIATTVCRVSRKMVETTRIEQELIEMNAEWKCTDQSIDIWTPEGRFMLHNLGAFAEYEGDIITKRTQDQQKFAAKAGRFTGGNVPYGYEVQESTKLLIAIPEQQAVINQIIGWRDLDRLSFQTIANNLNSMQSDKFWHVTSVKIVYEKHKQKVV